MLEPLDVIYDGQCRFCRACVHLFKWADWFGRFQFIDGSDWLKIQSNYELLASYQTAEGLCVIENESVFWGFFAVRKMILKAPLFWPLLIPFYFPGANSIGPKCYSWIAKNRYGIGCCNSGCNK